MNTIKEPKPPRIITAVPCERCKADLTQCRCDGVDEVIYRLLNSPTGKTLTIPYYNRLVDYAAGIIEARIKANYGTPAS